MTREEIRADIPNMPSRIEQLKAHHLAEYADKIKKGELEYWEVVIEVYERGIVDGRMWQLYLDRKEKEENDGKFYTLQEVSEKLRVGYRTALTYVESGDLKALKTGRRWRIREEDLQEFMVDKGKYRRKQTKKSEPMKESGE